MSEGEINFPVGNFREKTVTTVDWKMKIFIAWDQEAAVPQTSLFLQFTYSQCVAADHFDPAQILHCVSLWVYELQIL